MLSQFFAILVSVAGYKGATMINARFQRLQPLLVAVVLVWTMWWAFSGDWEAFTAGGQWISFWLGPATVALAIPLAKQIKEFAHIWRGVLLGVCAGCAVAIFVVIGVHWFLGSDELVYKSMLSKSVTTPIALELSRSIGGEPALAAFFTALTGMVGVMIARPVLKWGKITDDWAIGIAIGTSAHAIGTASLNRVSPVQTAASSVAMIVAGVITSIYLIPFSF
ncbi:LrgB family protein [Brevibacillus sp. DP1.3A]|uniref:LrgB family protein n=1 Tax=unclassified Brevibacillus TaxID=2684853 RepID=UPI00156B95C0|nr:LrgB family protein [Brevibacillus sp. DP1.3A]MED1914968.1 LrgB family protein [Bacillus thuringiensis]UED73137.1 LrgB family protein [Brevibacillus sp. DP1.3A]